MDYGSAKANTKGWKQIALLDGGKEVLKPFNNFQKSPEEHLTEIDQIIHSLPDGTYYLAVKNSPRAKPTLFTFQQGAATAVNLSAGYAPNENLYRENLTLSVRNKELETLNEIQSKKISELLETIAELEDELEAADSVQGMDGPPQMSILETIAVQAAPALLQKLGLGEDAPGTPGSGNDPTPPPVPGVSVSSVPRYVLNPDLASVSAGAQQNAIQGKSAFDALPDSDQKRLKALAFALMPFKSGLDDQIRAGGLKYQAAAGVKNYLNAADNFDYSGLAADDAAEIQQILGLGKLMLGGDDMKLIATNIEANYKQLVQWAKANV